MAEDPKATQVIAEIEKGKNLKHVEETHDKSAPLIDKDVHVKKIDRTGFLEEVTKPHDLKHADVQDKSVPHIEKDVHVKKVDRKGFLEEVSKGKDNIKHDS
eukprot:TRINITY_DN419_c0_g3_i3.p1 TRINITY_DN419_c0_g3~~TRINITY_DN419_c0_g3_i3.p1  ORF type:complete len:101 (+),score=28.32 TRINITY_DN419_c0_g3_i3:60-362(+)